MSTETQRDLNDMASDRLDAIETAVNEKRIGLGAALAHAFKAGFDHARATDEGKNPKPAAVEEK
jgi:hypothetical protein